MSKWQIRAPDRRHLYVVLPSYTGQIWLPTALSLVHGLWKLKELEGLRIEFCPIMFDAQIWMTRCQAATLFLASEGTDLIMIDWDMMFDPPAIARLLALPVEVVGCDYPRRIEPMAYSARFLRNPDRSFDMTPDANGLIAVEAVPSGLIRITRNAVERMVEAYPELVYRDDSLPNGTGYGLFANLFENGRWWGEDISFCRRFHKIGGTVYLDPSIAVSHWGQKQYQADYASWLKLMAEADPNDPRFLD